jgi:hypothetical protein
MTEANLTREERQQIYDDIDDGLILLVPNKTWLGGVAIYGSFLLALMGVIYLLTK